MTTLDQLAAAFRNAPDQLAAEARKVLFKAGLNMKDTANDRAGRPIKGTVSFEVEPTDDGIAMTIESSSPLGAIQEFGSPTFPGGKPFMEPAFDDEDPHVLEFLAGAMEKSLP